MQTVPETLCELFLRRGILEHIRRDNGSEFAVDAVRKLLADLGVKTVFIGPGSPWVSGRLRHGRVLGPLLGSQSQKSRKSVQGQRYKEGMALWSEQLSFARSLAGRIAH